ncbi:MAG TPA: hypothetical protein VNC22_23360 [Sporichthya sp.]|jgi:hypothetical protein|nr:hypothetical protein [Sporichthya sp.]
MKALKFGFELEVGRNAGAGSTTAARRLLYRNGLTLHDGGRHEAHCDCPICAYDRTNGLLAYQDDSSVAAEFVSRILSTRSVRDRQEMRQLVSLYPDLLATLDWTPDGDYGAGNHVHVGWPKQFIQRDRWGEVWPIPEMRAKVNAALMSLFASESDLWRQIADGGCGRHRSYNGVCVYSPYRDYRTNEEIGTFGGQWISDRGHGTVEFRLWNTPADPQRLMAHPAISTALMAWALAIVEEHSHTATFDRAINAYEYISGRALIERKRVVGLIKEIWADKPSARLAAELVAA